MNEWNLDNEGGNAMTKSNLVLNLAHARRFRLHIIGLALLLLFAIATGCSRNSSSNSGSGQSGPAITSVAVSCSPSSILVTQTSTCTATVTGTGNYSSAVTWSVSPSNLGTISAAGVFTPAAAGTATITATSTQDSTKSGLVTVAVTKASPTVTISLSASSISTSQADAATVTVAGNPTPTGSVTLSSGSYTSAATPLVSGSATINIAAGALPVGSDTLTATYTPDANSSSVYNSATGTAAVTVTLAKTTPVVSVSLSSPSITTAQTDTATVTVSGGTGNPTPTGSVTLSSGSYTSAVTPLVSGSATISIPSATLATGSDMLTATYTPDANSSSVYNSASGSVPVTVAQAKVTPTVTISLSATSITTTDTDTAMVTVTGAPTPTGSVTLTSGSYSSAATALNNGAATITIPAGSFTIGSDTVTVSYTPDAGSSSIYVSVSGTATVTVTAQTYANFVPLHSFSGSDGTCPVGIVQASSGTIYGTTAAGGTGANAEGTLFQITLSNQIGMFKPIYTFNGVEGAAPVGRIEFGSDGMTLFGIAEGGGLHGQGTVFMFDTSTTAPPADIHDFEAGTDDGEQPTGWLTLGPNGTIYGTTMGGGTYSSGEIFSISPTGNVSPVYFFKAPPDGELPVAGVTIGPDGNVYGTTLAGGSDGKGAIFVSTPGGNESTLYSFGTAPGDNSNAGAFGGLTLNSDGNLYGVNFSGGISDYGFAYKVDSHGNFSVIHQFTGTGMANYPNDAALPATPLILAKDGYFYGISVAGGNAANGAIYKIDPAGNDSLVYSFPSPVGPTLTEGNVGEAYIMWGWLIQGIDGNLYGTTCGGGSYGDGQIFEITFSSTPPGSAVTIATPNSLPEGFVGTPYSTTLTATGGTGDYAWAVTTGESQLATLGLSLASNGTLSGTPPVGGTAIFTAEVRDSAGDSASQQFTIVTTPALTILTTAVPFGASGVQYPSTQLRAAGGDPPYTWTTIPPNIPPASGLTLNISGTISGIPTTAGTNSFTAQVTDSIGATESKQFSITITPTTPVSTMTLDFGTVAEGSTSQSQNVTFTNTGSASISLGALAIIGGNGQFQVSGSTCSGTVQAGGNCSIGFTFAPTSPGEQMASLAVTDETGGSPQTVSLQGIGIQPITVTPNQLSFGTLAVGTTSVPESVMITNNTTTSLAIQQPSVSGPFSVSSNACVGSFASGAGCDIGITFSPVTSGTATGTLSITDGAASSVQTVALTGIGTSSVTGTILFTLVVTYQGSSYTISFYGKQSQYSTLQQSVGGQAPLAAQSTFLVGAATGKDTLSSAQVSQNGVPVSASLATSILDQTFQWAYSYWYFFCFDQDYGANKTSWETEYALLSGAISSEWIQEAGIVAYQVINFATAIGPALDAIAQIQGSTVANEVENETSLWEAIMQGFPQLAAQFPGEASAIVSVLQNYKLINEQNYTSSQIVLALANVMGNGPEGLSALTSAVYQAAFQESPSSDGNNEFDQAFSTLVSDAAGSATTGAATFLEIYFGAGMSATTAGQAATAAATNSLGFILPLSIATLVNQDVSQPIETRLQAEYNLENTLQTVYNQAESSLSAMLSDSSAAVNIANGADLLNAAGEIQSTFYAWTSVDQQLIQLETLKCLLNSSACATQINFDQTDGAGAMTNAWDYNQFVTQANSVSSFLAAPQ